MTPGNEENIQAEPHPARHYIMRAVLFALCFIIGMGVGRTMVDDGCIPHGSAWDRYGKR